MPITAAALAGLGTHRRRRRCSLPANVPLTKRRRQRRSGPSRDRHVTREGGAAALSSLRRLISPPTARVASFSRPRRPLGEANSSEVRGGMRMEPIREI